MMSEPSPTTPRYSVVSWSVSASRELDIDVVAAECADGEALPEVLRADSTISAVVLDIRTPPTISSRTGRRSRSLTAMLHPSRKAAAFLDAEVVSRLVARND
jgi:hypothetical protein